MKTFAPGQVKVSKDSSEKETFLVINGENFKGKQTTVTLLSLNLFSSI
jgi:hypothetical protein